MINDIIIGLGITGIICAGIYQFCKLAKEQQIEIILEWLTYAVIIAEKELGSGTGQVKLRFVYDLFIDKFKIISRFVSFAQFSKLVDIALISMKDILTDNKKIQEYIQKQGD